jgi:dTMP kinase
MKGKLIVIEGTDSSGKATQSQRLFDALRLENENVRKVAYPNYDSPSSSLVKMYLGGEFGQSPDDVNGYTASLFYAVDRFASYTKDWKKFYEDGGWIVADRYTTANMVHQASKISEGKDRKDFMEWLSDLEFAKLGLPVPDCVVFLDMPPDISGLLMKDRNNKITGEKEKDIHEKDENYLKKSYENALQIAQERDWIIIPCSLEGKVRSVEDIHKEILEAVKQLLQEG